jgi:hypothetical protein
LHVSISDISSIRALNPFIARHIYRSVLLSRLRPYTYANNKPKASRNHRGCRLSEIPKMSPPGDTEDNTSRSPRKPLGDANLQVELLLHNVTIDRSLLLPLIIYLNFHFHGNVYRLESCSHWGINTASAHLEQGQRTESIKNKFSSLFNQAVCNTNYVSALRALVIGVKWGGISG